MFGDLRKKVYETISNVCKMEEVRIIKAETLSEHVYMYILIPLKESVTKIAGGIVNVKLFANLRTICVISTKSRMKDQLWKEEIRICSEVLL